MSSDRRQALVALFRDETRRALGSLERSLIDLERSPEDAELGAGLMRTIHTIKGDAKIAGFPLANRAAHLTEDLLACGKKHGFRLPPAGSDLVLHGLDLIRKTIEEPPGSKEHSAEIDAFEARVTAMLQAAACPEAAAKAEPPKADAPSAPAPAVPASAANPTNPAPPPAEGEAPAVTPAVSAARPAHAPRAEEESLLRIGGEQLAALTSLSGSLLLHHAQLDRQLSELSTLAQAGADGHTERGSTGRLLASARTESFELQLQLKRLQEEVERIRLRRIGELFDRFPRAVRDLARSLSKRVSLEVEGGDVAVDKQVLDQLDKVLLHLVRNSVDHGIESPAERLAAGKPEEGRLWLSARPAGGLVEVTVRDDGRGIDPARLRESAVHRGLLPAEQAAQLSDEDTLALIFRAGFTTREQVSDISGRGVGLDVVKRQVEQLGGSVSCDGAPGQGARFLLHVPISVALTHVLIVELGQELYALPVTAISQIARVPRADLEPTGAGSSVKLDEERLAVSALSTLLARPAPPEGPLCDLVVVENGGRRLALAVELIRGQRHSVIRALDPILGAVGVVTGAVELEGGERALVLNIPDLFRLASSDHVASGEMSAQAETRTRILIVDDSLFAREMLGSLLRRLDFAVLEARDGAEGLNKLLAESPDLVMTDLDMPVLDGIAFIERIRELPAHRQLPIVVLSTRGSDVDKRRAMQAGANAYLVKSNFDESEVSRTLRKLLG